MHLYSFMNIDAYNDRALNDEIEKLGGWAQ